jgi:hypothetical protein
LIADVVLGYVGVLFMAYAESIDDMLLRALALRFLLDVDAIIAPLLVPERLFKIVTALGPLKVDSARLASLTYGILNGEKCMEFALALWLSLLCAIMLMANVAIIAPFVDNLQEAKRWLCGGDRDFVYTQNAANGVVTYARTPSVGNMGASGYAENTILMLTGLVQRPVVSSASYAEEVGVEALRKLHRGGASEGSAGLPFVEMGSTHNSWHLAHQAPTIFEMSRQRQAVKEYLNDPLWETCHSLNAVGMTASCFQYNGTVLRAACQETCGCAIPSVGQFFGTLKYGCSYASLTEHKKRMNDSHAQDPCLDHTPQALQSSAGWQSYTHGIGSLLDIRNTDSNTRTQILSVLRSDGCGALSTTLVVDHLSNLCEPGEFRTARFFCPQTCGCNALRTDECLPSCRHVLPWAVSR